VHEFALTESLVDIVLNLPELRPGFRVKQVVVRAGKLTAIVPEAMQTAFVVLSKDTPLEEAQLVIEQVPVKVCCLDCQRSFELEEPVFVCPHCFRRRLDVLAGDELLVDSVEIVQEAAHGCPKSNSDQAQHT
jgi:hydrogenase nickel incorporation protein HypA/HybF